MTLVKRGSLLLKTGSILQQTQYSAIALPGFYMDPAGNDANDGTTPSTAWRTLTKLESEFPGFTGNETIYFKRGATFPGTLYFNNVSGINAGQKLTFSTYGSGNNPILSGGQDLSAATWTLHSGSIWYTTLTEVVQDLFYNDVRIREARTGLRTMSANGTEATLVDSSLTGAYSQATIVASKVAFKNNRYVAQTKKVTSFSSGVVGWGDTNISGGTTKAGYGYFLKGHVDYLTSAGGWAYDPATQRLYVWLPDSSNPNTKTIVASTVARGIDLRDATYLKFENLDFRYYWESAFFLDRNCEALELQSCRLRNCYGAGIYFDQGSLNNNASRGVIVNGCTLEYLSGVGIHVAYGRDSFFTNNVFEHIGEVWGDNLGSIGQNGKANNQFHSAITSYWSTGNTITGNTVRYIGYCGIRQDGTNHTVAYNVVRDTVTQFDDGGGIYFYGNNQSQQTSGLNIHHNYVADPVSNIEGTTHDPAKKLATCLYLDNGTINSVIEDNVLVRGNRVGMVCNYNNEGNVFRRNLIFGAEENQVLFDNIKNPPENTGHTFEDNLLACNHPNQICIKTVNRQGGTPNYYQPFTVLDGNYYVQPYINTGLGNSNRIVSCQYNGYSLTDYHTLASWQAYTGKEATGTKTTYNWTYVNEVTADTEIFVVMNPTTSIVTVAIGAGYQDENGTALNTDIDIPPWTGKLIIKI
jgi:hypothetical protein